MFQKCFRCYFAANRVQTVAENVFEKFYHYSTRLEDRKWLDVKLKRKYVLVWQAAKTF